VNEPPDSFVRLATEALERFLAACLEAAGLCAEHAGPMARLLVRADLRGVHSHGARLLDRYFRELTGGQVNPRPVLRTVKVGAATVILDGDGGYGYVPTLRATEMVLARARAGGVAVGSVRNIGHYGAAGHYTRRCAEAGCIGFCVQGRSDNLLPDLPVALWGSRPMSFAIPAGAEHPVIVDGSTNWFRERDLDLFERVPSAFFMSLGLTAVSKLLGDALSGHMPPHALQVPARWPKGRSGAFILAVDVEHFLPVDAFAAEVDALIHDIARQMRPMPGRRRALLPGALEAERQAIYAREGVPIDLDTKRRLDKIAAELGVPAPW
jgi:LDH2 family malate/lactate/ureidoglycolate dehydrogenase